MSLGARVAVLVALFALLAGVGSAWAFTRDSGSDKTETEQPQDSQGSQGSQGIQGPVDVVPLEPTPGSDAEQAASSGLSDMQGITAPQPGVSASGLGISTTGSASVAVRPDRVMWTFTVSETADTAAAAQDQLADKARRVIDALKDAGVAESDLKTQSITLSPNYDYNGQPPHRIVDYTASTSLVVDTALEGASEIADRAVEAGVDQLYGPSLTVRDSERYYRQALRAAYEQARARAASIAEAAGLELGAPISLSASDYQPPVVFEARAEAADAAGVPIAPGQSDITATVSATFAIGG